MTPPHVERARDSVLGTLLHFYTPQSIIVVQAQHVQPRDFGTPESRAHVLYRAVLALHRDGANVDPVTAEGFLARHGMLERAGGVGYMAVLAVSAVPSSLKEHAFLLAEAGAWDRYLRALEAATVAAHARDTESFWAAVSRIRPVVEQPKLRVVKDDEAA